MSIVAHPLQRSEWLDLRQTEHEFPVSRRTLWSWISDGRLPAYKPFRKILIKRADIEQLLESTRIRADLDRLVEETLSELSK